MDRAPLSTINALQDRLTSTSDPTRRANLKVVIKHLWHLTVDHDLNQLMSTLSEDPVCRTRGGLFASKHEIEVSGREAVREQFAVLMATRGGFPPSEIDLENVLVGDDAVYLDGQRTTVWTGALLKAYGVDVDEPDGSYLESVWVSYVFPFVGGLIAGEDICFGPSILARLP